MIDLVAFDAYGTLFDVYAVRSQLEASWPGRGDEISRSLRAKQLEYSFLRTLMGRWQPFREVTRDALRWAVASSGGDPEPAAVDQVMAAYDRATLHDGAAAALQTLAAAGVRCIILTNGSGDMIDRAVAATGIGEHLETVLSVDAVQGFKPHPSVYAMVESATGVPPGAALLVSANAFDVAGAAAFGFQTCWVRRGREVFDELGVVPAFVVASLEEIAGIVVGLHGAGNP